MNCPGCGAPSTKAIKAKILEDKIRRIRQCHRCERRWWTVEALDRTAYMQGWTPKQKPRGRTHRPEEPRPEPLPPKISKREKKHASLAAKVRRKLRSIQGTDKVERSGLFLSDE